MAKKGGNLLYFAGWPVVNKPELIHKLYLIDADVLNSDLFSHQFNAEKQLQKCLVVIVLAQSLCPVYSNSHSLFNVAV